MYHPAGHPLIGVPDDGSDFIRHSIYSQEIKGSSFFHMTMDNTLLLSLSSAALLKVTENLWCLVSEHLFLWTVHVPSLQDEWRLYLAVMKQVWAWVEKV